MLLFICVFIFYTCSISNLFFSSYLYKVPFLSSIYAILFFFPLSVMESGNYRLVFK